MTTRRELEAGAWQRIARLFRELSDVCVTLAGADANASKANKPRRRRISRRRPPHHHVPDVEPSELDVARAKAILKRLGRL
jgi:hypothetical protein